MEEIKQQLAQILTEDKRDKSHLIFLLQSAQNKLGYLPVEAMLTIAQFLEVFPSTVYSIATFYNQFRFTPLGKHSVKVCLGTACHLAGGNLILEAVERELDVKVGGVTTDREFSLERVACIGCCAIAPVMTVDDTVYPKLTPMKVEEALVLLKPPAEKKKNSEF